MLVLPVLLVMSTSVLSFLWDCDDVYPLSSWLPLLPPLQYSKSRCVSVLAPFGLCWENYLSLTLTAVLQMGELWAEAFIFSGAMGSSLPWNLCSSRDATFVMILPWWIVLLLLGEVT